MNTSNSTALKRLPLDDMFNARIQVFGITMDELEAIATLVATQGNNHIWLSEDLRLKESHMLDIEGLWQLGTVDILEINKSKAKAHIIQLH